MPGYEIEMVPGGDHSRGLDRPPLALLRQAPVAVRVQTARSWLDQSSVRDYGQSRGSNDLHQDCSLHFTSEEYALRDRPVGHQDRLN